MHLNDFDDLPFHQAPMPFEIPWTSDVHFNDGYIFGVYAEAHYLLAGLRLHPNMNVMDGFAVLAHAGEERCVRLSRALRPHSGNLRVGALRVDVPDPMRRMRIALEESTIDLAFDLELESVGLPYMEAPYQHRRYGHVVNDLVRYTVPMRASGWLDCDGSRVQVERWHGMRDHSWGIRSNMGPRTPHKGVALAESEVDHRRFRLWVPFEVEGHSGFFHTHEDEHGKALDCEGHIVFDDNETVKVVAVDHNIEYVPGTRNPGAGSFRLTDDVGTVREYRFEVTGMPADMQGCGYYGGWHDGGNAGCYRGVGPVVETDRYSVGPEIDTSGPDHVPQKKRLGPTEFAVNLVGPEGVRGMAHFEHTVMGTYRPYGFE